MAERATPRVWDIKIPEGLSSLERRRFRNKEKLKLKRMMKRSIMQASSTAPGTEMHKIATQSVAQVRDQLRLNEKQHRIEAPKSKRPPKKPASMKGPKVGELNAKITPPKRAIKDDKPSREPDRSNRSIKPLMDVRIRRISSPKSDPAEFESRVEPNRTFPQKSNEQTRNNPGKGKRAKHIHKRNRRSAEWRRAQKNAAIIKPVKEPRPPPFSPRRDQERIRSPKGRRIRSPEPLLASLITRPTLVSSANRESRSPLRSILDVDLEDPPGPSFETFDSPIHQPESIEPIPEELRHLLLQVGAALPQVRREPSRSPSEPDEWLASPGHLPMREQPSGDEFEPEQWHSRSPSPRHPMRMEEQLAGDDFEPEQWHSRSPSPMFRAQSPYDLPPPQMEVGSRRTPSETAEDDELYQEAVAIVRAWRERNHSPQMVDLSVGDEMAEEQLCHDAIAHALDRGFVGSDPRLELPSRRVVYESGRIDVLLSDRPGHSSCPNYRMGQRVGLMDETRAPASPREWDHYRVENRPRDRERSKPEMTNYRMGQRVDNSRQEHKTKPAPKQNDSRVESKQRDRQRSKPEPSRAESMRPQPATELDAATQRDLDHFTSRHMGAMLRRFPEDQSRNVRPDEHLAKDMDYRQRNVDQSVQTPVEAQQSSPRVAHDTHRQQHAHYSQWQEGQLHLESMPSVSHTPADRITALRRQLAEAEKAEELKTRWKQVILQSTQWLAQAQSPPHANERLCGDPQTTKARSPPPKIIYPRDLKPKPSKAESSASRHPRYDKPFKPHHMAAALRKPKPHNRDRPYKKPAEHVVKRGPFEVGQMVEKKQQTRRNRKPVRVEWVLGNWEYRLSDGSVCNARQLMDSRARIKPSERHRASASSHRSAGHEMEDGEIEREEGEID